MKKLLIFLLLLFASPANAQLPTTGAGQSSASGAALFALPGAVSQINMLNNNKNAFTTWTATAATVANSAAVAPDGTTTASSVIDTAVSSAHTVAHATVLRNNGIPSALVPFRFMVDAKQNGRTRIVLDVQNGAGSIGAQVTCDLAGVQTSSLQTFGSGATAIAASATAIGGGFTRCILDMTPVSGSGITMQGVVLLDAGSGTGAINDVYLGNGSSGVFLWQASLLPKAAWNLTRQVFSDNFSSLSTIDTSNTGNAGFKWYVHNWPSAVAQSANGNVWRTFSPITASNLSLSSGVVIATDPSGFSADLMSAHPNGQGVTFAAPALFVTTMQFNGATSLTTDTSWPATFGMSWEMLTGVSNEFFENDFYEAYAISGPNGTIADLVTVHDWTISGAGGSSETSNTDGPNDNLTTVWPFAQTGWNTAPHTIANLWLSAASNSNTVGLKQTYVDGIFVTPSEVTWSAGAISQPNATPSDPVGVFSIGDSQHLVFMLGTGPSWPTTFSFAGVWTP